MYNSQIIYSWFCSWEVNFDHLNRIVQINAKTKSRNHFRIDRNLLLQIIRLPTIQRRSKKKKQHIPIKRDENIWCTKSKGIDGILFRMNDSCSQRVFRIGNNETMRMECIGRYTSSRWWIINWRTSSGKLLHVWLFSEKGKYPKRITKPAKFIC